MGTKGVVAGFGRLVSLVGILFLACGLAKGEILNWRFPIAGNWHDPNNWDLHRIPTEVDTLKVNQGEAQIWDLDAAAGEVQLGTAPSYAGKVRLDPNRVLSLKNVHGLCVGLMGQGTFTQLPGSQVVIDQEATGPVYLELGGSANA